MKNLYRVEYDYTLMLLYRPKIAYLTEEELKALKSTKAFIFRVQRVRAMHRGKEIAIVRKDKNRPVLIPFPEIVPLEHLKRK